ncbi:DUF2268 domain-containing putative Zn-dependent protease [Moritella dasanensis]|uniref:DUF2268 domain-containing putative Zn-dependent protease n=1 Tax=Moritella dasanensis TaxID=428031 RepID=UPI0002D7B8F2|nr:DUF2268 domain-containing putative Zn-dependent protease [Moritella dasanensis]
MNIFLHKLNAHGKFDGLLTRVDSLFDKALECIGEKLPLEEINIDVIISEGDFVIPEFGFCGYSPSSGQIMLFFDLNNENLDTCLDAEFMPSLGHEIHHCFRHKGVGYGKTLQEAVISEGLACHFEVELRNGDVPFYAQAINQDMIDVLHSKMLNEAANLTYDHNVWFFGTEPDSIPLHAGYTLGYCIVSNYIKATGTPASQLWNVSANEFFDGTLLQAENDHVLKGSSR